MKKLVYFLAFVPLLFIAGCSDNLVVPETQDQNAGPIISKITHERLAFNDGRVLNFNALGQSLNSLTLDESGTSRSYIYNSNGKIEELRHPVSVNGLGAGFKNYVYANNRLTESTEQFGDLIGAPETTYYTYVNNTIEKLTSEDANPSNARLSIYTFSDNTLKQLLRIDNFSDPNDLTTPKSSNIFFYDDNMNVVREERWNTNITTQVYALSNYRELTFDDKINMFKNVTALELIVELDLIPDDYDLGYTEVLNRFSSQNNLLRKRSINISSGQEFTAYDFNFIYTYNSEDYPISAERYHQNGPFPSQIYTFEYHD